MLQTCVDNWTIAFPTERHDWKGRSCRFKVEWKQCAHFGSQCRCSCGLCDDALADSGGNDCLKASLVSLARTAPLARTAAEASAAPRRRPRLPPPSPPSSLPSKLRPVQTPQTLPPLPQQMPPPRTKTRNVLRVANDTPGHANSFSQLHHDSSASSKSPQSAGRGQAFLLDAARRAADPAAGGHLPLLVFSLAIVMTLIFAALLLCVLAVCHCLRGRDAPDSQTVPLLDREISSLGSLSVGAASKEGFLDELDEEAQEAERLRLDDEIGPWDSVSVAWDKNAHEDYRKRLLQEGFEKAHMSAEDSSVSRAYSEPLLEAKKKVFRKSFAGAGQAGRAPSSSLVQTHGALQLASLARSGLISAGCALDVASNPAAKLSGVCRPVAEEEEGLIERKSHLSNQDGVLEL